VTGKYADILTLLIESVTLIAVDSQEIINSLCFFAILERWVVSYFLSDFLMFNENTYNKLSPEANYYINLLKQGLRCGSISLATFSVSHLSV